MEAKSAGQLWQGVAMQLTSLLSAIDVDALEAEARRTVLLLKRLVGDVRLDIRDYEFAEDRVELQKASQRAIKRLEKSRATILRVSEYDLLSAVDVALLSAKLDQLIEYLR